MKLLARTLSLLTIASLTLFFANCGGGGSEANPKKVQLAKLSKTWNYVSATLDGIPNTQITNSFTLTISGSFDADSPNGPYDYDVTGTLTPNPWPATGTWTFDSTSGNGGLIVRDDGTGIVYTIGSDGKLTLTFTYTGDGYDGARVSQVSGEWIIELD